MSSAKNRKKWKREDKCLPGSHEWGGGGYMICIHCGATYDNRHKPCLPAREEANFQWVDGRKVQWGKKHG
jgi:hypothetical protein